MYPILRYISFYIIPVLLLHACRKSIEADPPINQINSTEVFQSDSAAKSALLGIYSEMMATQLQYSSGQLSLYAGLSANELQYFTPGLKDEFANCEIGIGNHPTLTSIFWNPAYKHIYTANLCLKGLDESKINPSLKESLTGEALFIRAFCYFQLVNLFGDIPLVLNTDYRINSIMPRSSVTAVYRQLTVDLERAAQLLPASYANGNRVVPIKWAAKALLARIYLYQKDWNKAEQISSEVINSSLYSLPSLSSAFLKNSPEAIFQLQPVNNTWNTWEGREILPATANETPKYILTQRLFNSFVIGDNRKTNWIGTRIFNGQTIYYPTKYKVYGNGAPVTEYYTLLRLAEQYLIRAEARAHHSNLQGALPDLNVIRQRAGLPAVNAANPQELFELIEKERQAELFVEWGHRWFDIRRTNRINDIMSVIHPSTWKATDSLYPIPADQLNLNPYLTQNPGY